MTRPYIGAHVFCGVTASRDLLQGPVVAPLHLLKKYIRRFSYVEG